MKHMKKNLEYRSVSTTFESSPDSRTIKGLAIPVESRSQLLYRGSYFYETIKRNAVNEDVIKENDIKLYLDHDPSHGTFARSKYGEGSMKLSITERGLEFEFEAPNTVFGDMLLEGIRRGDYDAMSFGYLPDSKTEEVKRNEDGTMERTVNGIQFLDELSILSQSPAFLDTDVNIRSIDDFKESERKRILQSLDDKLEEIEKISNIDNGNTI